VLEMSGALPDMRRRIAADLRRRGLERDRVPALALHLLDLGYFRAGSEQYAEENNSYGIATLLCEHVALDKEAVEFDYPAKSGVRRTLLIDDPEVVRSVRALWRGRGRTERLLVCRTGSNSTDLHADDLNARFKELVGDEYTVKDLRTWPGTVLGAAAFEEASAEPPAEPPLEATPADWQDSSRWSSWIRSSTSSIAETIESFSSQTLFGDAAQPSMTGPRRIAIAVLCDAD
jgi:DNA topoisomerase I